MTNEIMRRTNNVYARFYNRKTGNKVYRANFGRKYSAAAFKRATDAIDYKSRAFLRYTNLKAARDAWSSEQTEKQHNAELMRNLRQIETVFAATLLPFVIGLIVYLLLAGH